MTISLSVLATLEHDDGLPWLAPKPFALALRTWRARSVRRPDSETILNERAPRIAAYTRIFYFRQPEIHRPPFLHQAFHILKHASNKRRRKLRGATALA